MSIHTRQTLQTMTISAARIALGGFTSIVIARELGPQGRGAYAVVVTVATTAVVLGNLSIDASHTSLWANARTRDHTAISANSLFFGLVVGTFSALITELVIALLGPGVIRIPGNGVLVLALAAIPCSMTAVYLNNALLLRGRIETVNWGAFLSICIPSLILLLLILAGEVTLEWLVALWTVSAAIPLAILLPAIRPRLRNCDFVLGRRALSMGLRYHIGSMALYLLLRADVLILNALTSTTAVGIYAVAVSLAELTRVAADCISQVILSRQMNSDDTFATALTVRITRLNALVALGSVSLMCVLGPAMIPIVYGSAFQPSVTPLFALVPGLVAMSAARMMSDYLLRLRRPLLRSGTAVIALLLNVGLNLVLIPAYGIIGCAVASSISYSALAVMQVGWFLIATRTPIRTLVPGIEEIRYMRMMGSQLIGSFRAT